MIEQLRLFARESYVIMIDGNFIKIYNNEYLYKLKFQNYTYRFINKKEILVVNKYTMLPSISNNYVFMIFILSSENYFQRSKNL